MRAERLFADGNGNPAAALAALDDAIALQEEHDLVWRYGTTPGFDWQDGQSATPVRGQILPLSMLCAGKCSPNPLGAR